MKIFIVEYAERGLDDGYSILKVFINQSLATKYVETCTEANTRYNNLIKILDDFYEA